MRVREKRERERDAVGTELRLLSTLRLLMSIIPGGKIERSRLWKVPASKESSFYSGPYSTLACRNILFVVFVPL